MKENIFEHLGLTFKEAEVYKILLKLGETPVSNLFNYLPDHSQIIYRAIDGLATKNLAVISIKKHRKYVRAEDPRILQQMEEENLKEIKQLVPELLALQKNSNEAIVRVLKGNEAVQSIRENAIDDIDQNGTFYTIGASGDRFYEIMGSRFKGIENKRVIKHITKKMISSENQRENILKENKSFALNETRFLPSEFPIVSSTSIYKDNVIIFVWTEEPIVIHMQSPEVAESYIQYFETLWQIAEE